MPIYRYVCPACAHEQELMRNIHKRRDPVPCPECGEPQELRPPTSMARPRVMGLGYKGLYHRYER